MGDKQTYTEIFEHVYGDNHSDVLESLRTEERKAWKVIKLLDGRKGFDHWWDSLDADIRDDIFDELVEVLGS